MDRKTLPKRIKKMVTLYGQRLERVRRLPIDRVIVFGSQTMKRASRWSDIDVCIVSRAFKDPITATNFLFHERNDDEVLGGLEPIGFSVKDFAEGGGLIQEIQRTGITLSTSRDLS